MIYNSGQGQTAINNQQKHSQNNILNHHGSDSNFRPRQNLKPNRNQNDTSTQLLPLGHTQQNLNTSNQNSYSQAAFSSSESTCRDNHMLIQDNNGNFAQHIGQSMTYFVVFVDPETLQYYRLYINNNTFIQVEQIGSPELKRHAQKVNYEAWREITKQLYIDDFWWDFKEADYFKRRLFPSQFLQNQRSEYPCYVFQSPISKAFNSVPAIDTQVDLSEFLGQNKKITIREQLVTSTSELIENIIRSARQHFQGREIVAKPDYVLILKAQNFKEYFEGNYQLLQYERVRTCLRKKIPMEIILTQIPKNYRKRFPPLFKNLRLMQDPQMRKTAQMQNSETQAEHVTSILVQPEFQQKDKFDIKKLVLETPPYFWYSPVKNLKEMQSGRGSSNFRQGGGYFKNQQNLGSAQQIPVEKTKKWISLTHQRHMYEGSTVPRHDSQMVMKSGECSFKFKFRILCLQNINLIFKEIEKAVATDNLATKPSNVTLNQKALVHLKHKKEEKQGGFGFWLKKKLGMKVNEGQDGGALEGKLSKQLKLSIQKQDTFELANSQNTFGIFNNAKSLGQSSRARDKSATRGTQQSITQSSRMQAQKNTSIQKNQQRNQQNMNGNSSVDTDQNGQQSSKIILPGQKPDKHGTSEDWKEYMAQRTRYCSQFSNTVQKLFCNFGDSYDTIQGYKGMLKQDFDEVTPMSIRVECTVYHGCDKLLDGGSSTQTTRQVYFTQNINFNEQIVFGELRYCQIPIKARLSFNIVLRFEEDCEVVIGSVSVNLFDEKGQFRSGIRDLNVWPFYQIDERLGCMKEYYGMSDSDAKDIKKGVKPLHTNFTKLMVQFEQFICPLVYSSRDERKIKLYNLIKTKEDADDEAMLLKKSINNQQLAKLKKCFEFSPLADIEKTLNQEEGQIVEEKDKKHNEKAEKSKADEIKKADLFQCREHYQTYPKGLPFFLKSVQWNRPVQVNEVYNMLECWAHMDPEDAIQLLDARYPDEKVRLYAVQRISLLSDDMLRLYMLQLTQALLYEENHISPLSEMLIQRSLRNPYVVGLSFFWSLKPNLSLKPSYERFYVLLEQFLMLCGDFRKELAKQQTVIKVLQFVSETAQKHKEQGGNQGGMIKTAREAMGKVIQTFESPSWGMQTFTTNIEPKFVAKSFIKENLHVFGSAKAPLLVTAKNHENEDSELKFLFKNGDDLRQDILTLQIIDIMDRIWLDNELDLAMTPYKVLVTGCEQGIMECNLNAVTLADIQHKGHTSIMNAFSNTSITEFFNEKITTHLKKEGFQENTDVFNQAFDTRLKRIRDVFRRSCAGYCVASYVLGLGDRHPDNIMINYVEGNFLHIDFGHFLENKKKVPGTKIPRETDPFVFTPEVAYFINGGPFQKKKDQKSDSSPYKKAQNSLNSGKKAKYGVQSQNSIRRGLGGKDQDDGCQDSDDFEEISDEEIAPEDYYNLQRQITNPTPEEEIAALNKQQASQKQQSKSTAAAQQAAVDMDLDEGKSADFIQFERECCQAYNCLREQRNRLVNLFLIMLSAGMPELQVKEDIYQLEKKLQLSLSQREAEKEFKREIQKAMANYRRRVDNAFHNWKQIKIKNKKQNEKEGGKKKKKDKKKK